MEITKTSHSIEHKLIFDYYYDIQIPNHQEQFKTPEKQYKTESFFLEIGKFYKGIIDELLIPKKSPEKWSYLSSKINA